MRINENTIICGDRAILVPYRREHVPVRNPAREHSSRQTYHEWMKSPELLELTASEPLSFDAEVEMQQKWHLDEDKLTFIVLARPDDLPATTHRLLSPAQIAQCRMVGDVNLFLPNGTADDAECEIMIAEKEYRRKGIAVEALSLFLTYAVHTLGVTPHNLIARIGTANTASIALFERLGFGKVRVVEVFGEAEMRWGWKGEGESVSADGAWPASVLEGRTGPYEA